MSVDVKTPTRTQFEHTEFQCGDKKSRGHSVSSVPTSVTDMTERTVEAAVGRAAPVFRPVQFQRQTSENFRHGRKRRYSERGGDTSRDRNLSITGLNFKRRFSRSGRGPTDKIVLPTKFLLGGNINDPLNLDSLNDEAINKALNESTPKSSPLAIPYHRQHVHIIIPPNIEDPLGLDTGEDPALLSPRSLGKNRKKRNKHNKKNHGDKSEVSELTNISSLAAEGKDLSMHIEIFSDSDLPHEPSLLSPGEASRIARGTSTPVPPSSLKLSTSGSTEKINFLQEHVADHIVSPVIPQTTSPKMRRRKRTSSDGKSDSSQLSRLSLEGEKREKTPDRISPHRSKFRRQQSQNSNHSQQQIAGPNKPKHKAQNGKRQKKFIFGNYNQYYGYRNPDGSSSDNRLKNLDSEWFNGNDVLDIGCNAGHVTLEIAKTFNPKKITGIDIDSGLIGMAKKNIRHYLSGRMARKDKYPSSMASNYGPIAAPPVKTSQTDTEFPNNVFFLTGNYVLESDELVDMAREEYDVIMALSVTKWMHLNWGDEGLKRTFRRMYKQLRPGGKLILEPQLWPSYKKRKKLSETHLKNFSAIQLKPEQFRDYLLREIGFSKSETLEVPYNKAKGFQRPLLVFTKSSTTQPCSRVTTPGQSDQSYLVTPGLSDFSRGATPRFQVGWSCTTTPNTYGSSENVYTFSPSSPNTKPSPRSSPAQHPSHPDNTQSGTADPPVSTDLPGTTDPPVSTDVEAREGLSESQTLRDSSNETLTQAIPSLSESSIIRGSVTPDHGLETSSALSHSSRHLSDMRSNSAPGRLGIPASADLTLTNGHEASTDVSTVQTESTHQGN